MSAAQQMRRPRAADAKSAQSAADRGPEQATSKWEWLAAALGALLVTAALSYMTYYGLTHPEGSPRVVVEPLGVIPTEGGYLVRFRARNEGESTAAGLLIAGELKDGESTVEESEATLDYLPQHSSREGGLFFTQDPSRHELQLSAKGYARP